MIQKSLSNLSQLSGYAKPAASTAVAPPVAGGVNTGGLMPPMTSGGTRAPASPALAGLTPPPMPPPPPPPAAQMAAPAPNPMMQPPPSSMAVAPPQAQQVNPAVAPAPMGNPVPQQPMTAGIGHLGGMPQQFMGGMPGGVGRPAQPPIPPPAPPQAPQPVQPSVEQQALNGGGVDNKQQISNFMQALRGVGAGANNGFMQGGTPAQPQSPPPLVGMVNQAPVEQMPQGAPAGPYRQVNAAAGMQAAADAGMIPYRTVDPKAGMQAAQMAGITNNGTSALGSQGYGAVSQTGGAPPKPQVNAAAGMQAMNMMGMSDETQKHSVSDATAKLHDFMGAIGAHSYQYKNPERDGVGTFTSPMAQELQKTDLGKQAVIQTKDGLMVDYARLGGVNLAAVSVLHREQQKLAAEVKRLREGFRRK